GCSSQGRLRMECAICFNHYNNAVRTPKLLLCRHTFCLECLARIRLKSQPPDTVQCPLCRFCTRLPAGGLPTLDTNLAILAHLPEGLETARSIRLKRQLWGRPKASRAAVTPQTPVSSVSRSVETGCPPWQGQPPREQRCCGNCWHKRLRLALLVMAAVVTRLSCLSSGHSPPAPYTWGEGS
uniref:RING-type domain-containing protein n=1 Tax=Pelusios castaneus TaxID=367368 RepID=A0A8C8SYE7_9SAUR